MFSYVYLVALNVISTFNLKIRILSYISKHFPKDFQYSNYLLKFKTKQFFEFVWLLQKYSLIYTAFEISKQYLMSKQKSLPKGVKIRKLNDLKKDYPPSLFKSVRTGDYLSLEVIGIVQIIDKTISYGLKEDKYYFKWKMPYGTLAGGITEVKEFKPVKTEPIIFRMLGFEQKRNPFVYTNHIPYCYYLPVHGITLWTNQEGNEFHLTQNKKFWSPEHNKLHLLQQQIEGRFGLKLKLEKNYKLNYSDIYLFPDET